MQRRSNRIGGKIREPEHKSRRFMLGTFLSRDNSSSSAVRLVGSHSQPSRLCSDIFHSFARPDLCGTEVDSKLLLTQTKKHLKH